MSQVLALIPRSNRAEVRNPIAADPEVAAIMAELPAGASEALRGALQAISRLCKAKGDACWVKRKYILAAYWKCVGVYARHLSLAVPRAVAARRRA
jgi:hypothetical protein